MTTITLPALDRHAERNLAQERVLRAWLQQPGPVATCEHCAAPFTASLPRCPECGQERPQ